jgi:hypothetical protein
MYALEKIMLAQTPLRIHFDDDMGTPASMLSFLEKSRISCHMLTFGDDVTQPFAGLDGFI